nr:hypothetical protein [Myxococcota bacterium]
AREALVVAPGATTGGDDDRPLRAADVDRLLARAAREPDGRYRALASRVLPGTPVGGSAPRGTRAGDANDTIAHQDRRDQRGLLSLAAWLNHTDIKPANTLDVWIPDPADATVGHVVHYLLDFGKALGAMARIDQRPEAGFAYYGHTFTPGAVRSDAPWQRLGPFPALRGLGWLESEHFDLARWTPLHPWLPFQQADRFDRFWGARIVMSFTPAQLAAALAAARYSEPQTVAYLTRVLRERQRKIGEQAFRAVAPLVGFDVRGGALCFADLWVRHALGGGAATYTAVLDTDADANANADAGTAAATAWQRTATAASDGTVCVDLPPVTEHRPVVIELRVARPGQELPPVRVHVGAVAGAPPCVIAIDRR